MPKSEDCESQVETLRKLTGQKPRMMLDGFFSHITIVVKQLLPLFNVFGSGENYVWLGFKDID